MTTVWNVARDASVAYEHPTQKPVELVIRALRNSSMAGQVVYDPCLGSGTTMIACEQLDRRCYGMDLDPAFVDVILRRWERFTGREAVKVEE